MTTRRSTRLQNLPIHEPSEQPLIANPPRKKYKPNPPSTTSTQGVGKGKAKATKSTPSKGKQAQTPTSPGSAQDQLSSLPPEILKLTLDNISDLPTISSLGRTCRNLYAVMMPRLYNRVAVAAAYHAHIAKLIRTLEPHLSIKQKRALKKEGKYKGQQERYPGGLDEKARPICAGYVSQMIVGMADPGRKHKYIVERYVEEALKNMENLQIVESMIYTKSIGESIASMKNLKALHLYSPTANLKNKEDVQILDTVKDLKHLYIQDNEYGRVSDTTRNLLRNSISTLQSVVLDTGAFQGGPFHDLATDDDEKHAFTALESLSLSRLRIDKEVIKALPLIDFMKLRELTVKSCDDDECLLYPYLASLATASRENALGIGIRHLSLNMGNGYGWQATPEKDRAYFEAKCHFLSSFDTLTTLELPDYTFNKDVPITPRLPNLMLQAILKHKNLKVLKIRYRGISSNTQIPYLSPAQVDAIIQGLPKLEEFVFPPDEGQMDGIGKALAKGRNLTSITCFPYDSWSTYPPPERPGFVVLSGIIKGILTRDVGASSDVGASNTNTPDDFIWETHTKLKTIEVASQIYALASQASLLRKLERKAPLPEIMFEGEEEGSGRSVWFRHLPWDFRGRVNQGFDVDHPWVSKVEKMLG